jgi:AAA domain
VPWLPTDHPVPDQREARPEVGPQRQLVLTRASDIEPRCVHWLRQGRLALGTLALLAGREGIGKSILIYTVAAMIIQGCSPASSTARRSLSS